MSDSTTPQDSEAMSPASAGYPERKAFLVTEGAYSDYHVLGVFTTKEKAEAFADMFPEGQRPDIEETSLDAIDGFPVGRLPYAVKFDREGNSTAKRTEPCRLDESCIPRGDGVHMLTSCWATDETHAIKIANERRAMVIAGGLWETNYKRWRAGRIG